MKDVIKVGIGVAILWLILFFAGAVTELRCSRLGGHYIERDGTCFIEDKMEKDNE